MKKGNARTTLLIGMVSLVLVSQLSYAQTTTSPPEEKKWNFTITPYFWLADIGATITHGSAGGATETEVEVGTGDYLDKLEMALPLAFSVQHGRWSILSDLLYMKLGDESSRVKSVEFNSGTRLQVNASADAGTSTTLKVAGWTLLSAYRLFESDKGSFEPILGLRYFGTEAKTDWSLEGAVTGPGVAETFQQTGSVTERGDLWDMLIGFRGEVRLGNHKLFVPYYLDMGTGQSDFTWQGMTGISYPFNWGELSATYRHLGYQTDELVKDLAFSGPSLGVSFQF